MVKLLMLSQSAPKRPCLGSSLLQRRQDPFERAQDANRKPQVFLNVYVCLSFGRSELIDFLCEVIAYFRDYRNKLEQDPNVMQLETIVLEQQFQPLLAFLAQDRLAINDILHHYHFDSYRYHPAMRHSASSCSA